MRTTSDSISLMMPEFPRLPEPVIVAGMHRSGTSMVSGMLSILGVHMDPDAPPPLEGQPWLLPPGQSRLRGYGEAAEFRRVNERVFFAVGAEWDRPQPLVSRMQEAPFQRRAVQMLRQGLRRPLRTGYFRCMPTGYEGAWGWKDPRNSLTISSWLEIFPAARVLHVHRDPDSVARSLVRREGLTRGGTDRVPPVSRRILHGFRHPVYALRWATRRMGITVKVSASLAFDHASALELHAIYTNASRSAKERAVVYLEIEYRDVLSDPFEAARQLAGFAGVEVSRWRLRQAAAFVAPPRLIAPGADLPVLQEPLRERRRSQSLVNEELSPVLTS